MTSHSESMVLSYSLNGDVFPPAGNQVLLDLQIGNDLIVARFSSKTVLLISFLLTAILVYWI